MPRTATTILGFVMVAVSLGVNAARYPVVWEMVGPTVASDTARTARAKQPQSPDPATPAQQQPTSLIPPPIKPIAIKPGPEVGDEVAVATVMPAASKPGASDVAMADDSESKRTPPLVPVAPVGLSRSEGSLQNDGVGIRRLPPVSNDDERMIAGILGQTLDGGVPVYPSTGLE